MAAPSLTSALAIRTAQAAEQDPHFRWTVTTHAPMIGCVAELMGTDPAHPSSDDQVRIAYAHLYCAGVQPGGRLDSVEQMVAPAAVTFDAKPVVTLPQEGGNYTAEVQRVIPRPLWDRAFAGLVDPQAAREQLRRRLSELAIEPSPS